MQPYEKIITRQDGSRARILVQNYALPGFPNDIGFDVFKEVDGKWHLLTQSPEEKESSLKMSVDEYIIKGRHPMFYVVTPMEILVAISEATK